MCTSSCSILLTITSIISTYNAQRTLKHWEFINVSVPIGSQIYGYSSISHDIFLLNSNELTTYNVLTNEVTIYPSATSHLAIGPRPYCHAQINHTVYFVANYTISKYHLDTNTIEYPFTQNTVTAEGPRACCTLSNDAKYFFILGGSPTGSAFNKVNQFIIYDIDKDTVSSGPVMNERRSGFNCHVVNDVLYAIGGDNNNKEFDSIERIDIQNMNSIESKVWIFTSSLMSTPRGVSASTIFNNAIYIIGGSYKGVFLNVVERFDGDTESLYDEYSLPVVANGEIAVTVDNRIYVIYDSIVYWSELVTNDTSTAVLSTVNDGDKEVTESTSIIAIVSTNYTVYIEIKECDDDCNVQIEDIGDLKERIVQTLIAEATDIQIVSTEIKGDEIIILISVETSSQQILESDTIKEYIEKEVEDDDTFGDIDVSIENDDETANESNDTPWIVPVIIISVIAICIVFLFYCLYRYHNKRKTAQEIVGNIVELSTVEETTQPPGTVQETVETIVEQKTQDIEREPQHQDGNNLDEKNDNLTKHEPQNSELLYNYNGNETVETATGGNIVQQTVQDTAGNDETENLGERTVEGGQ